MLIICKQISMLITLMISRYLMWRRGLDGWKHGWGVEGWSLSLSHLGEAAKWWSNLSDLWLGAGPGVIACHSGTDGGDDEERVVVGAPQNTKYPPLSLHPLLRITSFPAPPFDVSTSLSCFPSCCLSHCGLLLESVSKKHPPNKRKIALIFKWWYYIKCGDLIYQNVRTTPFTVCASS